jgi:metal-responsive CopG/Arc/MetJ family transcriptional regulator
VRTTIELSDDQRARLLAAAARRGEKGFSTLVQEAVDRYLQEEADRQERVRRALTLAGSLSDEAADALEASVRRLRETWR